MSKANKIPDRWMNYEPFGDVIKGTNILPLKVPLRKKLVFRLREKDKFTPDALLDKLDKMNYKLGLLIDLTATTRYYNPQIFIDRDVQYVKIFTQGHVVPSPEVIEKFTTAMSSFKESNKDKDTIIGVHCTHGVNRTGYLICRYLIEHEGFKPEDALKAFKDARGYPVERQNYINDLLHLNDDKRASSHTKKHYKGKGKNDHHWTRNNHDHDKEIRRGHQHFYDPYQWNGRAQQDGPFRSRGGSLRRDRGMDHRVEWQGQEAYYHDSWNGGGHMDPYGPNWNDPYGYSPHGNAPYGNDPYGNGPYGNDPNWGFQPYWQSYDPRTCHGGGKNGPSMRRSSKINPGYHPY
ncbi:RNA/RNP complex-1-interacting phosphatase-like [Lytechinus variegatus]|uniref:RNA/RNP complex-1-interacting phosphatase-like n=1 Tax=Lytechinus variegatus TaxID=7654 RepID=UPI001BB0F186|nr:RNA/RNP complex-1-interacting phosphatase-like [Lytechinus variegatus]